METPDVAKMTLSELYEAVGEDITDVLERLEDIETVELFALGFADDPSYAMLLNNLQEKDFKSAFCAAHTLKGISYSIGFKRLGDCAASLCKKLREGIPPSTIALQQLKTEYDHVITAIKNYKKSN